MTLNKVEFDDKIQAINGLVSFIADRSGSFSTGQLTAEALNFWTKQISRTNPDTAPQRLYARLNVWTERHSPTIRRISRHRTTIQGYISKARF